MTRVLRTQNPFEDLFFKNFFYADPFEIFTPKVRVEYPVDVIDLEDAGIGIEIAAVGIDRDDIEVQVDGSELRVKYDRDRQVPKEPKYISRGITRKKFDLGWRIGPKYDIKNIKVGLDKGLLKIHIPLSEENKPRKLTIN